MEDYLLRAIPGALVAMLFMIWNTCERKLAGQQEPTDNPITTITLIGCSFIMWPITLPIMIGAVLLQLYYLEKHHAKGSEDTND